MFWPLALLLGAVVLGKLGRRVSAVLVGVAAVAWPVAHIGNIGWLAVTMNALLVLGLVPLAWLGRRSGRQQLGELVDGPMAG